jgi:3-oxoacyl-[acyl-carrier-protein] synthase II
MISDIAGHISIKYGFRGPNFVTVSAASSTNAIIDAFNYIRLGHADVMVTGGSSCSNHSRHGDSMPCMHCQQEMTIQQGFQTNGQGQRRFVLGEGAGALI